MAAALRSALRGAAAAASQQLLSSRLQQGWSAFATQAAAKEGVPTVKAQLRALYRRVHPDLFQGRDEQQRVNTHSFKLLQQYLDGEAKTQHDNNNDNNNEAKPVSVSLPPVSRSTGFRHAALARLFAACGLGEAVAVEDNEEPSTSDRTRWSPYSTYSTGLETLADYLRQASEHTRQAETASFSIQRQISVMQAALYAGQGLSVSFNATGGDWTPEKQREVLQRLSRALDMMNSQQYGIDWTGAVWLNTDDSAKVWSARLAAVNVAVVTDVKLKLQHRRHLEEQVARHLQVGMVFTDPESGSSAEYSSFLQSLNEKALSSGPVRSGLFEELPLQVVPRDTPLPTGKSCLFCACATLLEWDGVHGFGINPTFGVLLVPIDATPDQVYEAVERFASHVVAARMRHSKAQKQRESLLRHVQTKLRLRHMAVAPDVTTAQLESACGRLLRHARSLMPLCEGLPIRISLKNNLRVHDSGFVDLRWDFQV
eukprot:jgi/Chlat1/2941/Chrsp2S04642